MNKTNSCAVVVSYNPDAKIVDNISALIPQLSEIVVIDNNSSSESQELLRQLEKQPSVTIIYNSSNLGIASALNQGVKFASQKKYEWLATFDQDSLAPNDYLKSMFNAYKSCDMCEQVAIISPRYQTSVKIISFSRDPDNSLSFNKVKTTMTSGNLVKLTVFEKVGLFDESYFIDYVDHEFCLRVRSIGLSIIESHATILNHSLGNSSINKLMGLDVVTTGHSATRRYYKYRNMVKTFKKYYWFEPLMLIADFKALAFEPVKILLFEDSKSSKIKAIFKGLWDGLMVS